MPGLVAKKCKVTCILRKIVPHDRIRLIEAPSSFLRSLYVFEIFGAIFFSFFSVIFAESAPEQLISHLREVQKKTSHLKSFMMPFEQISYSALRKRQTKQKGVLEFLSPRSFRWEILGENQQLLELFVSNGDLFWKYTARTKHAQKMKSSEVDLDIVNLFLDGDKLFERYKVFPWTEDVKLGKTPTDKNLISLAPPDFSSSHIFVKLEPKNLAQQNMIFAVIEKTTGVVKEVRFLFENGNRSQIIFEALKEQSLPQERFNFVPPAGTAID